jgi:hypothetical protein
LAADCPVRPVVIVVVLPLAELLVEEMDVVGHAVLVQQLVKLSIVDAISAFDLAIQMRGPRSKVDVTDVRSRQVPMEARLARGFHVQLQPVT